ncbi:MAG TPA: TolC family protein [Gemmatimonadales bacterium]
MRSQGLMAFFWLVAAAMPARAQQQDTTTQSLQITLADAIQRALQVQPSMVTAQGNVRSADAQRLAANGAFLPSLSVSGSSSRSGGTVLIGNQLQNQPWKTNFSGSLSANIDLFTGFRRIALRSAAGASQDAADAGLINQRYQTTLATKQAFYNALADEELVRVAEAQLARTRQELQISVDKLRVGSATRSDSLRSAVDYGNARIALLQAQSNLAFAQATLGRQIGVDRPVRAVPDTVLPPLPDTSGLRDALLGTAPQVRQADAQARAARAGVWASRSSYWPTFSASLGKGYSGNEAPWTSGATYGDNTSIRFGLSWTLFNGFTREQGVANASVSRDIAEAQAADTRRAVNASLTQAISALETASTQLDIAQANLAAATEDMRVQQERYRVGASTILDLLTSQAALTTAGVNVVQTRFNYLISRATLEALVGHEL